MYRKTALLALLALCAAAGRSLALSAPVSFCQPLTHHRHSALCCSQHGFKPLVSIEIPHDCM